MLAAWLMVAMCTAKHSRVTGKLVGFLQWHVWPKLGLWPWFARGYYWMRWGAYDQAIPLQVLHALWRPMVLLAEAFVVFLTACLVRLLVCFISKG